MISTPHHTVAWKMKSKIMNQIYRGLMTAAYGDAMGVPFEFKSREYCQWNVKHSRGLTGCGTHNQPPGTWSDDTSLTLATVESICQRGGKICYTDMMREFVRWRNHGAHTARGVVFDIGGTTSQAIARGSRPTKDVTRCGPKDNQSCGNGSLMRILPVAIRVANLPFTDRVDIVSKASKLTHGHRVCQLACVFFSEMVRTMILSSRYVDYAYKCAIENCRDLIGNSNHKVAFSTIMSGQVPELAPQQLRGDGYVMSTLTSAINCAIRSTSTIDGLRAAISLGQDTDTTACVTGALLGLQWDAPKGLTDVDFGQLKRHAELSSSYWAFATRCVPELTSLR